ncbi:alpha/beta fold hydrolase [Salaquimonas pukyongi]|uniref:alpha/beta fold hydrolase n=1 Tax=Salaquimonas pukyongi TaxID=2712698 RepID=UPI00096BA618|nr:alpha/beta hydrolase [Salaquimonas pukyongi]
MAAKETILFIPGHMCDERLFAPQIAALKGRYNIVVAGLKAGEAFETYIDNALEAVGDNRFNLVGLSMGGMLAAQMAAQHPRRVLRLALLSTTVEPEVPERAQTRRKRIERAKKAGLETIAREELAPSYLAAAHKTRTDLIDTVVAMAVDHGVDVFAAQSAAMTARRDCRNDLPGYKGPVLVLCGEEDRLFSVEKHKDIAELFEHSELVIQSAIGHLPVLEAPEATNAALETWLSRRV